MAEYLLEVYWLAAYSLLRWARKEPRGRCCVDGAWIWRYRHVHAEGRPKVVGISDAMKTSPIAICATICVDLVNSSRSDYACNADPASNPCCLNIPRVWMRYLHDAEKIVEAYRVCGTSRLNQLLQIINASEGRISGGEHLGGSRLYLQ